MRELRARLSKLISHRRFALWAVLAGLAIRVAWGFAAGDEYRFYDSDSYVTIADNLLAGNGFLWGDQRIGRPPIYPLVVAALRTKLFGREFLALYLFQSLLSAAAIFFFASGARRLVGKVAGGITAGLLALDPFLVFYSGTVLSETLFIFFLSILFYSVASILQRPLVRAAVLGGLAAGAAFLTRPSVPGVLICFIAALIIYARPRLKGVIAGAVMALTAALVVMPWAIRNHEISGHWVFTTLGVGASLYDGVGPQADGSSNMDFLRSMPELDKMNEYSRDRYLLGKAFDAVVDRPFAVAGLSLVKAYRFWAPVPNSETFRSPLYMTASVLAVTPVYIFAVLALFTGVMRRRDFVVLASVPAYFTLVHMVFVGSTRYRVPVMPFVAMLAAAFLAAFLARGKRGVGEASRMASHRHARHTLKRRTSHKKRGLSLFVRIFVLALLLGALGGSAGYAYYARWVANPANIRALAIEKLGLLFPGKKVDISTASFSIINGLDLSGVGVFEGDDARVAIGKLDQVHIDFRRRSLARLRLVPESVIASGLYLDIVRNEDGNWNLSLPVKAEGAAKSAQLAPWFSVTLQGAFVSIDDRYDDYSVSLSVESATAASASEDLALWRMRANFGGPLLGKWNVSAEGDVREKRIEMLFGVVELDLGQGLGGRLPSKARKGYDFFSPSGPVDVSGEIAFSPAVGWQFDVEAVLAGCGLKCAAFPAQIGDLSGRIHFKTHGSEFESLDGKALGGSVAISGHTRGYGSTAEYHMTIAASGMHTGQEFTEALGEKTSAVVEHFSPKGIFDAHVKLDRQPGEKMPLSKVIEIYPKGMEASYDLFAYPLEGVTGHLTYDNGSVDIEQLTARRARADFVISGFARAPGGDKDIDITVTSRRVPLDEMLRTLLPEGAARTWKSLGASGTADVDTRVRKKGEAPIELEVDARLSGLGVYYEGFPYRLDGGGGKLWVSEGRLGVDISNLSHGGALFAVTGGVTPGTGEVEVSVGATGLVIDKEFMDALPAGAADVLRRLRTSGHGRAKLTIWRDAEGKGGFKDLQGVFVDGRVLIPEMPLGLGVRKADFSCDGETISFDGVEAYVFPDNVLSLMPVVRMALLSRPPTGLALTGQAPISGSGAGWHTQFEVSNLAVSSTFVTRLPEDARETFQAMNARGLVDASGVLSYSGGDTANLDYDAVLDCTDGAFLLGRAVKNFNGHVKLHGRSAGGMNTLTAGGRLTSADFGGYAMGETDFELTKDTDEARLDRFATKALAGEISGQARIGLGAKKGFGVSAEVKGVSLSETLEKTFGFHKEGLSGTLDGRVKLMNLSGRKGDMIISMEANITRGTLWEVPMILAVMNVLNLKIPERAEFDRAHVRLNAANGTITIEELSMSSDPATLFGRGTMSYDGELDVTFYSQPGKIPIVSLLAGEVGRNIVQARIMGNFAEPSIWLVPSGPLGKFLGWFTGSGRKKAK